MIESIRYTKKLPDKDYFLYSVSREQCTNFKKLAADFSDYASLDFILLDDRKEPTEKKLESLRANWEYLKAQNVCKANYLCHDYNNLNAFPLFLYEYFK